MITAATLRICVLWFAALTTIGYCEVRPLNDLQWTATNGNKTINIDATVPGGIYTDLINAKIIKDYIFYKKNDMNYRWVGKENWTYSTTFKLTKNDMKNKVRLVFHGLDTIASIWLNGRSVGTSTNMFVRTAIDVKRRVHVGTNRLEVRFKSPIASGKLLADSSSYKIPPLCPSPTYHGECNVNQLRKMQASFSWDWGPAFPSVGIWKPVELELMKPSRMRNVGFRTFDIDSDVNNYLVEVTVWFDELTVEGHLTVKVDVDGRQVIFKSPASSIDGECKVDLMLPKRYTQLWWPRGYGNPNLHKMTVTFSSQGIDQHEIIYVGVRTVEIKQLPIVDGQEQKGLSFFLMVNKVPVFVKGSNWIPMDVLPEKGSDPFRLAHLLQSAANANFNALRVWGGGVYESDLFYELCDRYGLLIWQDLMFACAMYPVTEQFLHSVHTEIDQQVKRLHYHPSIFAYGGNNENEAALVQNWYGTIGNQSLYTNDYLTLYVQTIKPVVEIIDKSRPFFTSSPSNGEETVRQKYVAKNPQDPSFGDVHFYIYFGNLWDPNIFPVPRFASEYGMQSFPSIHTMSKVLESTDLFWNNEAVEWRQHLQLGSVYLEFQIKENLPWSTKLEDIIYLSQINQAMAMKTETEHYRRYKTIVNDAYQGRTMGALFWQLNDVWEAPTWSSIDYEGNWKMLHYYARNFLADLILIPIKKLDVLEMYIVSDANTAISHAPIDISFVVFIRNWNSFQAVENSTYTYSMLPGESMQLFSTPVTTMLDRCDPANCFLTFEMNGSPEGFFFPKALKSSNYPDSTVKIAKSTILDQTTVMLNLEATAIALFVWLETPLQNMNTTYSDNGFHMFTSTKTVNVTMRSGMSQQFVDSIQIRNLKKSYV